MDRQTETKRKRQMNKALKLSHHASKIVINLRVSRLHATVSDIVCVTEHSYFVPLMRLVKMIQFEF